MTSDFHENLFPVDPVPMPDDDKFPVLALPIGGAQFKTLSRKQLNALLHLDLMAAMRCGARNFNN